MQKDIVLSDSCLPVDVSWWYTPCTCCSCQCWLALWCCHVHLWSFFLLVVGALLSLCIYTVWTFVLWSYLPQLACMSSCFSCSVFLPKSQDMSFRFGHTAPQQFSFPIARSSNKAGDKLSTKNLISKLFHSIGKMSHMCVYHCCSLYVFSQAYPHVECIAVVSLSFQLMIPSI